MEELGVTGAPMSPTVSLPTDTIQRSHGEDDITAVAGEDGNRPTRMSRVSRLFNPLRRSSVNAEAQVAAETDQEAEYNEELVDWLDIIGKQLPSAVYNAY